MSDVGRTQSIGMASNTAGALHPVWNGLSAAGQRTGARTKADGVAALASSMHRQGLHG